MGALISGLGRSRIDELLPQVPAGAREKLAEGLGAGQTGSTGVMADAVEQAFLYALNDGLRIAAVVAALGAVLAWVLIDGGVAHRRPVHDAQTAEAATGPAGAELAAPGAAAA
jgi:hypothetical protein